MEKIYIYPYKIPKTSKSGEVIGYIERIRVRKYIPVNKLYNYSVDEIKNMLTMGLSVTKVCKKYELSRYMVTKIRNSLVV